MTRGDHITSSFEHTSLIISHEPSSNNIGAASHSPGLVLVYLATNR